MKIICWNLRNLGGGKLARPKNSLSPSLAALNLGCTLLEYIVKVVTGDPVWSNMTDNDPDTSLTSNVPADIFVIIELKSGGKAKGRRANGGSMVVLPAVVNALNAATDNNYDYAFMNTDENPLPITGYNECVGVIYNQQRLTYNYSKIIRDGMGNYLNPKTPYYIRFTVNATQEYLTIIGLHAPPVGKNPYPSKRPVDYSIQLGTCRELTLNDDTFIMGDFNCDPNSSYLSNGEERIPFDWIEPSYYEINLPTPTLTSVKTYLNNNIQPPPANYLSQPFDNIIFKPVSVTNVRTQVLDTIGKARNMSDPNNPTDLTVTQQSLMVAQYFKKFSDHLPVQIEFDIPAV